MRPYFQKQRDPYVQDTTGVMAPQQVQIELTWEQAGEVLRRNGRIRHKYYTDDEWIEGRGWIDGKFGQIISEDDIDFTQEWLRYPEMTDKFFMTGWCEIKEG